jgi:hypothetical protein
LLSKIHRRLSKLGDPVDVNTFGRVEDILAHTRKYPDPLLEALAFALARECGLQQPGDSDEAVAKKPNDASTAGTGEISPEEGPEAASERRARAAQRARELEQTLVKQRARSAARARRRESTTPAAVEQAVQSVLDGNPVDARPQTQTADATKGRGSRMGRLVKGLIGAGRTTDAGVSPPGSAEGPKKKIMYRGRVIEI